MNDRKTPRVERYKGVGQKQLEAAGFQVEKIHNGRWFEVIDPNGTQALVLRQSGACWHWFSKHHAATASSSNVASCHKGGLGDAIGSDSQMRTYKRLLDESNVPRYLWRTYAGLYAACEQVYNETH